MIRVFIEVASALTRAGLEALLREQTEIEIVSAASEADVAIYDHGVEGNGSPSAVVFADESSIRDALRKGARAALPSSSSPAQIVAAIYAAAAGLTAIPAAEMAAMLPPAPTEASLEPLTPRELDVLEMLAEGLSNKMIAYRLSISTHTAKFHVNAILAKLRAGTRTEAVTKGIRLGLIQV